MSSYYQERGIGDLGQGKVARYVQHRANVNMFNRGMLTARRGRSELPPKPSTGDERLYKVYDFMTVNNAKTIPAPMPKPDEFNKGALKPRRGHVEAPPTRATVEDVARAFDNHVSIDDSKNDELPVSDILIRRVEELTSHGYTPEFVRNFMTNLRMKSRERLTSEQERIYDEIMGDIRHPKHRQFSSEESNLIKKMSSLTGLSERKFKEIMIREILVKGRALAFDELKAEVQDDEKKAPSDPDKDAARLAELQARSGQLSDISESDISDTDDEKVPGIPVIFKLSDADRMGKAQFNAMFGTLYQRAGDNFTGISKQWNGDKTEFITGLNGNLLTVKQVKNLIRNKGGILNTRTMEMVKD